MTRYLDKSFSVYSPGTSNFRDNWDAIFGKKNPSTDHAHEVGSCHNCPYDKEPEPEKAKAEPPEETRPYCIVCLDYDCPWPVTPGPAPAK